MNALIGRDSKGRSLRLAAREVQAEGSTRPSVTVGLVRFPLRAQRHGEPPAKSGVPCFS